MCHVDYVVSMRSGGGGALKVFLISIHACWDTPQNVNNIQMIDERQTMLLINMYVYLPVCARANARLTVFVFHHYYDHFIAAAKNPRISSWLFLEPRLLLLFFFFFFSVSFVCNLPQFVPHNLTITQTHSSQAALALAYYSTVSPSNNSKLRAYVRLWM